MADCFLYFRVWPGFNFDQFPVDQFNAITDDKDLSRALDAYAREQIRRPEVRHQIRQTFKTRQQAPSAPRPNRRGVQAMRPAGASGVSRSSTTRHSARRAAKRIRRAEQQGPLICRLGAYLGWWRKVWFESLPFGPQVWFHRMPSSESAEMIVSLLNGRTLDYNKKNEVEIELQPRFGFVGDLELAMQASAQCCIDSIRDEEQPDIWGADLALEMGKKAMRDAQRKERAVSQMTPDALQKEATDDRTEAPAHVESVDNVPIGGNGGRANEGGETEPRKRKQSDKSKYVDDLMKIYDSVKAEKPNASNQDVANAYNNKYRAPIANSSNSRKRATDRWVKTSVYDRRRRPKRKQKNS